MSQFIQLTACPRCGSHRTSVDADWLRARVFCHDCNFEGPLCWHKASAKARQGAVEKWNSLTSHPQDADRWRERMSTGTDFGIAKELDIERYRQIAEEGWTAEHDDAHTGGELASAAACYCSPIMIYGLWPWAKEWWKPKDRRRDLVRAGALIIAEIERLDRQAAVSRTPRPLIGWATERESD